MPRFAQAKENVRVASQGADPGDRSTEVERVNAELGGTGRVLVRPSGTEPLDPGARRGRRREVAEKACASIAALVQRELG